ncbi:MAG: xanthine dehydrogenase family protein subunit M [Deltaproteobacteria bacterium]|jgi:CO/xanthine dehydrogenase FAD-binding subunit|nr:xanthine dehydrogenase family protein subunit M [Deltaproteobacteria bacterium]
MKYITADNLESVAGLLKANPEARILAGGTDMLVGFETTHSKPESVLDITDIPELQSITATNDAVVIGAVVTMTQLATSPIIQKNYPALAKAASSMGCWQIQNVATVGGNLCQCSPCADTACPLLVYEAKAELYGNGETRTMDLQDFLLGPGENALNAGEILKSIHLPLPKAEKKADYQRFSIRKSMDIALVTAATEMLVDSGNCQEINIFLGAVAPTPIRASKAENLLRNQTVTPELIMKVAEMCADEASPITDIRATKEYRKIIIANLINESLSKLAGF